MIKENEDTVQAIIYVVIAFLYVLLSCLITDLESPHIYIM